MDNVSILKRIFRARKTVEIIKRPRKVVNEESSTAIEVQQRILKFEFRDLRFGNELESPKKQGTTIISPCHGHQGCHGDERTDMSVHPSIISNKVLVCSLKNIRADLSIF